MKSIANQYRDLKEGRMSQSNFMRNVRMMMPQYITNVTSFKDAVRILKNKSILTEGYDDEPSYDYNGKKLYVDNQSGEPDAPGGTVDLYDEDNGKYTGIISSIDKEGFIYVDPESIQPAGEDEDGEIEDMIAKAAEEESGKYTKFQDFPGAISEKSYKVSPNAIPVSSLKKGDILAGSNLEVVSISAGAKTPSGKMEVTVKDPKTGNEVTKVWGKSTKVTIKKDLKEGKGKELNPNQINPDELRMGIKVELEHTDDLDKAKKIALDHLAENPYYYTALKLAGIESPSAPKIKAPKEAPKKAKKKDATELVDKANQMQKVKMPKDKINEDYESWLSQKKGEEARAKRIMQATNAEGVKFSVNDIAKTPDGKEIKITGFTTGKDGKMKAMYSAGMFADVYNLDDLEKKPSFRPGVDLGASFEKFKSQLEEVVREVIAEYYDGRDNLDAENEY